MSRIGCRSGLGVSRVGGRTVFRTVTGGKYSRSDMVGFLVDGLDVVVVTGLAVARVVVVEGFLVVVVARAVVTGLRVV